MNVKRETWPHQLVLSGWWKAIRWHSLTTKRGSSPFIVSVKNWKATLAEWISPRDPPILSFSFFPLFFFHFCKIVNLYTTEKIRPDETNGPSQPRLGMKIVSCDSRVCCRLEEEPRSLKDWPCVLPSPVTSQLFMDIPVVWWFFSLDSLRILSPEEEEMKVLLEGHGAFFSKFDWPFIIQPLSYRLKGPRLYERYQLWVASLDQ